MSNFQGADVNDVLRLVQSRSSVGDVQLTILAQALAIACKSCGVSKANALEVFEDVFDEKHTLVALNQS